MNRLLFVKLSVDGAHASLARSLCECAIAAIAGCAALGAWSLLLDLVRLVEATWAVLARIAL